MKQKIYGTIVSVIALVLVGAIGVEVAGSLFGWPGFGLPAQKEEYLSLEDICSYAYESEGLWIIPDLNKMVENLSQTTSVREMADVSRELAAMLESGEYPTLSAECNSQDEVLALCRDMAEQMFFDGLGSVVISETETPWGTLGGAE